MTTPLLTFDDGPSESTAEILDLLHEYGISATFLVIGFRAEQQPDLVERAAVEGHTVGNHTWNHVRLAQILNDATDQADLEQRAEVVKTKLEQTNHVIERIVGAPPTLFRGPWLDVDDRVKKIAADLGLTHIEVDVDTHDYDDGYD